MASRGRYLEIAQAGALVAVLALTVTVSRAADWDAVWLFGALLVLAIGSDAMALRAGTLRISGSFAAIVLAMAFLGPAPAVVIGVVTMVVDAVRSQPRRGVALANVLTYAAFPLVGGLVMRLAYEYVPAGASLAGALLLVFALTNVLNFVLIYGYFVIADGKRWGAGFREIYLPVLPVEAATGLLTAGVFLLEQQTGPASVVFLAVVVLVFQYFLKTALEAQERGDELATRNQELAALHLGLITTVLRTLSLRDHMTARHSAAVARYARTIATALDLPEDEVELIHTAALFHDVGKFIFPDSILLADRRLTDDEYEVVKRHPVVGAELIAEIEGYEAVARIVRHHHERIDGRGYPDSIAGEQIPLGSRIIAVADVYDVITARDTYRTPVTVSEAIAELERSAGSQLDAGLVQVFVDLVVSEGVAFHHGTAADFEAELSLERRISDYAAPRAVAA